MSDATEAIDGHTADGEGTACTGWDSDDCAGTPHCPPRCPRFVDGAGTPLLILPFDADAVARTGALAGDTRAAGEAMDEATVEAVSDGAAEDPADVRERTLRALLRMYDGFDVTSQTLGLPPNGRAATRRWLERLTDDGWNLLAWDGEAVVGHVGVVPADEDEPELVVFVHPDYQGRGLGTELVRQAVAYAAAGRAEALRLSVAEHNRGAIHVYRNVDFAVADRLPEALEMRLALDAPVATAVRRPPKAR